MNLPSITAQEIDFGSYSSQYTMTLTDLTPASDLDFGLVITGIDQEVDLFNAKVLSIEGVSYLDVIVDVTGPQYLTLDGAPCSTSNCRIPFTVRAAYANKGTNSTSQAILMTTIGLTASAQFPIKYRGNAPPGPPPTPVYEGYNPSAFNETAYLYIYGDLDFFGVTVDAGNYSGDILITVQYD
ncbi:MAG: hypothetical protein ED557_02800 [Balneola sp.]|nr:MAG: hypothetical protein ED557_02800 [Balneola sp.]